MSERKKFIKKVLSAALLLFCYYIFVRLTGISIPCVFYEITGLKCPSCGITAMAVHMAEFRFSEAFECNPLLFFMLPFLGTLILIKIVFMPEWLTGKSRIYNGIMITCCILLVIFGVLRNLAF